MKLATKCVNHSKKKKKKEKEDFGSHTREEETKIRNRTIDKFCPRSKRWDMNSPKSKAIDQEIGFYRLPHIY